jgi:hypothetical protein
MQMTLSGGGQTLRLDSSLDGFNDIARMAARAGIARNIEVSDATRANLAALNIAFPAAERPA